ncbi:MAG: methylaspartate ammonia-lyase [Rhizobiaceae bacterium]
MHIAKVLFTEGVSCFVHQDREAIRRGARPNGYLYEGQPVIPGFTTITQPAGTVSIMLVLDDGSVAFGDCVDVILAGYAGRDRPFIPAEHRHVLESVVRPFLEGAELSGFRAIDARFDDLQHEGKPLHTAIRYGASQAVLHAHALAARLTMAEVVAQEYGTTVARERLPILSSCMRDNHILHDRMILKRADLLPHSSFGDIDLHIGRDGGIFLDYVGRFARRVQEIGAADYRPTLHFDVYGSIGSLFGEDPVQVAAYLGRVAEAAGPYPLMIESPFVMAGLDEQIEVFARLRREIARQGVACTVIADEWCNTLDDIRAWGAAEAVDMVQIKTPDLGSIARSIDAVLYCRSVGLGSYLGGTANETQQSSVVTCHAGLATGPDFLLSKPGMGGDESFSLQVNEMQRTIALVESRA